MLPPPSNLWGDADPDELNARFCKLRESNPPLRGPGSEVPPATSINKMLSDNVRRVYQDKLREIRDRRLDDDEPSPGLVDSSDSECEMKAGREMR